MAVRARPGGCDVDLPVLILKTAAQPLHHGTLAIIRSLGRMGVRVYCSRERGPAPVARSRYLRRGPVGVLPKTDRGFAVEVLRAFQKRLAKPLAIIPADDGAALLLAETAASLGEAFRLPRQPPDLPRSVASKANLPLLCASAGTPTPPTVVVRPTEDLASATAAINYPAVVKIAQPWLLPPNVRAAVLASSAAEAAGYRSLLGARGEATVVVQEFIPHEVSEDWFYHGYLAAGGDPVVGFTGRKLRSFPPLLGATSYGISAVNHEVRALAETLLRRIGYAGIVELEFRLDRRDGRYKLIDINPRPGAQFQFLRNARGVDVVRALHLDLSGRPVPLAPQVEGRTFISDFTDLAALGAYRRRGDLTVREWLGQALAADEHAWFAPDDLAPFFAAALHSARSVLHRKPPPLRPAKPSSAGAGRLHLRVPPAP